MPNPKMTYKELQNKAKTILKQNRKARIIEIKEEDYLSAIQESPFIAGGKKDIIFGLEVKYIK